MLVEKYLSEIMDAWRDADGSADKELRGFLRNRISKPKSWAVLDGDPKLALLFGDRRVMFITAAEDKVLAICRLFPEDTIVAYEPGNWEDRHHESGRLSHWTFDPPKGEPLKITGWKARDWTDRREEFARALATMCGWPFGQASA